MTSNGLVSSKPMDDQTRLAAVIEFANNVLRNGRDHYRSSPTPLFADGINVFTKKHVKWVLPDNHEVVISDLACQQNLLRTLVTLSKLTGDSQYQEAAKATIRYHFDHLIDSSGLLQWGGHRFIDLATLQITGPANKGMVHELKNALPYYELMFEVNPVAATKFIKAFWNAHIYNWDELHMGRHGEYGLTVGEVWEHPLVNLPPFRESPGLSFMNTGADLIYSAGTVYRMTGEKNALRWAKHFAEQYVAARDPHTGLGAYEFTQPRRVEEPYDDNITLSKFGDRAKRQFGPEFGDAALEGKFLNKRYAGTIYGEGALTQMELAVTIGQDAAELLEWTHQGLLSYAKYAYVPETNQFKTMFIDGTDLSGYVLRRNGYYGKAGQVVERYSPTSKLLLSYARAFLYIKDPQLWQMARNIGKGFQIGDLGSAPGENVNLNFETQCADAIVLLAIIDLYRATENIIYLNLARIIGNNIVNRYFHHGYFSESSDLINASFDEIEPFALLTLEAAITGKSALIPNFLNGKGYIHGMYQFPDGTLDTIMSDFLYQQRQK